MCVGANPGNMQKNIMYRTIHYTEADSLRLCGLVDRLIASEPGVRRIASRCHRNICMYTDTHKESIDSILMNKGDGETR